MGYPPQSSRRRGSLLYNTGMVVSVKPPETAPEKTRKDGRGKAEGSMATQKRGNAAVQQARVTRLEAEAQAAMPDDPAEATWQL